MAALCGDVFISKILKFRLSFAIFQYSNPSFPYISYHPLQIFHFCKKIRGRADHRFIFELSSSQEQSVKVRKGNFATQDLTVFLKYSHRKCPKLTVIPVMRRGQGCALRHRPLYNRNNSDGKASLKRQRTPETTTDTKDVYKLY